jgi:hypothetical protein
LQRELAVRLQRRHGAARLAGIAARQVAAQRSAARVQVLHLGAVGRGLVEGQFAALLIGERQA